MAEAPRLAKIKQAKTYWLLLVLEKIKFGLTL